MSNEVFANGNEIACKSGDDKVVAAFPDVCLSPPSPPAGPIPIPYPNTSFSKDMKKGSKSVKIDGKEIMLKDQSFYKTSPLGDEAATKSLGAGVISHVITGKTYFVAWSMDVKFEGENVDRHLDLTTSNHASPMANEGVPVPGAEGTAPPGHQQLELLCECCNLLPPHSAAQARGEAITEEEFYGPTQTGPRRRSVRGGGEVMEPRALTRPEQMQVSNAQDCLQLTRDICPDTVPPDPLGDDPCNRYYRNTPGETQAARGQYDDLNNVSNPLRPEGWGDALMIAHRVPLNAGGCPVGPNTQIINSQECHEWDPVFGKAQNEVSTIGR